MAKKKERIKETTIENYYDLKVDKVDELVAALKGESPVFEEEVNYAMNANMGVYDPKNVKRNGKDKEFDPYKTDFLGRVPTWIKALFIKFWFAGAVCYFMMMGIMYSDGLDAAFFTGIVLGIIVDVLVNPLFRYMETDRKEYNNYMMFPFPFKAFWTFFTNILYYLLVIFIVSLIYGGINSGVADNSIGLGVEPLLFGVICVAIDMIFIGIKDGVVALVRHLKNRKKEKVPNV